MFMRPKIAYQDQWSSCNRCGTGGSRSDVNLHHSQTVIACRQLVVILRDCNFVVVLFLDIHSMIGFNHLSFFNSRQYLVLKSPG